MNNITISGNQQTVLDNELIITSMTTPGLHVLRVDTTNNTVLINKPTSNAVTLSSLIQPLAAYLANYRDEFKNPSFFNYALDGDSFYISDGGGDMYDAGNYTYPWLLSGVQQTNPFLSYSNVLSYSNTVATTIDTDFIYASLGYVPNVIGATYPSYPATSHPLMMIGTRTTTGNPIGFQKSGNSGADGGGSFVGEFIYQNASINGFTVYSFIRQTYAAGDPSHCDVYVLVGHPLWGSVFGSNISSFGDPATNGGNGGYLYTSGANTKNILAITLLLSKLNGVQVTNAECQASVTAIVGRIKTYMDSIGATLTSGAALDIEGSLAVSSTFNIQSGKLIVDAAGNIGINTTPSSQLHVNGNVLISGSLSAFSNVTTITTTSFETTDPNIVLNVGGNDSSASAAGLLIERTTTISTSNGITNTTGIFSGSGSNISYGYQFTASGNTLTAIATNSLSRSTTGAGTVTATVYTSSGNTPGAILAYATNSVNYSALPLFTSHTTTYAATTFSFNNVALTVGTTYYFVITANTSVGNSIVLSGSNISNNVYSWPPASDLGDISLTTFYQVLDPAEIAWDNVRSNFRSGLSSNLSSFALVDGNSDGAAITIGPTDNFNFHLKTNNTNRITVSSSGDVSFPGNLDISGSFTMGDIPIQYSGAPLGAIVSFLPGTFSNSSNGTFTVRLGATNDADSVNTWLLANGYDHWRVCDGKAYNIAGSPLYGGSNRFTPNITDDRFLMGSTTAGDLGGSNTRSHAHTISTELSSINLTHTHTITSDIIPHSSVSFAVDNNAAFNTGTSNVSSVSPYTPNTNSFSHSHTLYHSHSAGDYRVLLFPDGSSWHVNIYSGGPSYESTVSLKVCGIGGSSNTYPWAGCVGGSTGSLSASTNSELGSYGFNHSHPTGGHVHTICHSHGSTPNHNHGSGCHGHTDAGTTWSLPTTYNTQFAHNHNTTDTSMTENRPLYLACFYLVRVS